MKALVVGGAGYIGSHTARALLQAGHQVVLLDNLIAGHAAVADRLDVKLYKLDIAATTEVAEVLANHNIEIVYHFAAFAAVGESVHDPAKYYLNNVAGTLSLLEAMRQANVSRMVFSSTCATYGMAQVAAIDESHSQQPINPYGRTKLYIEHILQDYAAAYGIRSAILRYFNAAGCSHDGLLGEDHTPETHLIPIAIRAALKQGPPLTIFGTDYPTPDGTCIRDYIHVEDLADAHLLAGDALAQHEVIIANLGSGTGCSVRQIIDGLADLGYPVPVVEGPRRAGDPPVLVAAGSRAKELFGWCPQRSTVPTILESAVQWFRQGGRY